MNPGTEPQSCTAPSFERCQHVEVAKECADLPPSQAWKKGVSSDLSTKNGI